MSDTSAIQSIPLYEGSEGDGQKESQGILVSATDPMVIMGFLFSIIGEALLVFGLIFLIVGFAGLAMAPLEILFTLAKAVKTAFYGFLEAWSFGLIDLADKESPGVTAALNSRDFVGAGFMLWGLSAWFRLIAIGFVVPKIKNFWGRLIVISANTSPPTLPFTGAIGIIIGIFLENKYARAATGIAIDAGLAVVSGGTGTAVKIAAEQAAKQAVKQALKQAAKQTVTNAAQATAQKAVERLRGNRAAWQNQEAALARQTMERTGRAGDTGAFSWPKDELARFKEGVFETPGEEGKAA